MKAERQWFDDNFAGKVNRFVKDLDDLESYLRLDRVYYEPLSMQEREMIVKTFDFGTPTILFLVVSFVINWAMYQVTLDTFTTARMDILTRSER